MTKFLSTIFLVLTVAVAPGPMLAEDQGEQDEATAAQHEAEGAEHAATAEEHTSGEEHGEEHHFHKNHIAVNIASTEGIVEHGEEHHGNGHGEVRSEGSSGGTKDDQD